MSCNVIPLKKYAEISYRVKCVSVEDERVFGDVYVTQQTRNLLYCADGYQFPALYHRRKCNLIHRNWEGPDFMEMNRKRPIRRASVMPVKVVKECLKRSRSVGDTRTVIERDCGNGDSVKGTTELRNPKTYPSPLPNAFERGKGNISSLVDQLLLDIYGFPDGDRGRTESDSTVSSLKGRPQHSHLQKARLLWKSKSELQVLILNLRDHINHTGGILIRQLRRKDYLSSKREKQCDIITAYLQAHSRKRVEDTKMRFSLTPQPGESGFIQWLDAMKMVARLQGGIPPEFRKKLWLTLAERHLEQRGVDWKQAEKVCFNEWSNPDDEELGIQIVKDLHRTGCSLFCGAAGRDNQAVLRRVLLGFARWNKSVGYCQGLNVLAALVLQVMDRAESAAVKVMIYLIEGVLPEGYFADNLRGLSVDMAVFRDLLRVRLPKLSKHLEALQNDAKDKATGSSYEPPLTNVFTMQWFLTLFCHCLPQEAVLRVWDLIFLEGDEILLRTALTIWEGLSDRIMTVTSADEFYSIMGVLTREMLEFTDTNNLIKNIVSMGPLQGVTGLREKHRYNITPWARKLSDDEDSDTEEDERLAVAAAMFSMAQRLKKDRIPQTIGALQAMAPSSDRERLALDISTLKQQYAKLRERQRQAHIILSAACARQTMVPPPTSQAMNHLLVGKNALVSGKNRPLSLPSGTAQAKTRPTLLSQTRRDRQQGVTLHWKDTKKAKQKSTGASAAVEATSSQSSEADLASPKHSSTDSDSDSTSTELCDEPDRLSDVDSEDLTSASESLVIATDEEKTSRGEGSPMPAKSPGRSSPEQKSEPAAVESIQGSTTAKENLSDMSIAKITDQIRRLSAEDDNNSMVPQSFSVRSKSSPDDWSMNASSLEKDKSALNLSTDYTSDNSVRKSLGLDEYDYLACGKTTINVKEEEVLVHERHRPKESPKDSEDPLMSLKDQVQNTSPTITQRQDSEAFSKYSTSLDTKYERICDIPTPLDTRSENGDRYKSSFDFSSRVSLDSKTYETSKIDSSVTDTSNTVTIERNPYCKTYVGHLPISPITVDQKLSEVTSMHGPDSIVRLTTESTNSQVSLEKTYFIDRIQVAQTKTYLDLKKSPKTPESNKSFSSGETMGPDSKPSSSTVSPRTPIRSDSRDYLMDKSVCSSVSSDSKTLVLRSVDSDVTKDSLKTDTKKTFEKSTSSTPISTDSLKNKSETSPKLIVSSSSESCSPGKMKSSERSFSSDLQSPISANSIKYTSNYNRRGQDDVSGSPMDLSSATSPFYPISNPNQKTPSPYSGSRQRSSLDSTETSPEQKSSSSKESNKYLGYQTKFDSTLKTDVKDLDSMARKNESFVEREFNLRKRESGANFSERRNGDDDVHFYHSTGSDYYRKDKDFDDGMDDPLSEKDVVPCLPQEKLDKRYLNYNYRHRDRSKQLERSSSSLDSRRFSDMKSSASTDEFADSVVKKRCSDILEDIKHLEAKAHDGSSDSGMLTKKSSYIWEDIKSLEARRQDTFSDSASNFSKRRLEIPDISVTSESRKSYVIHPKINIDENPDSILNTVARSQNSGDSDDGRESKLGVWTKVKPRRKGNNGRRNSDRALKIIQENSVILQKILACQAKKRLPDLEEISKEITISPINEEISKIFSPILEKMGLNEHEINEELARINFKDFDNMTATSVSEFDAKINEELSKLSLIDDNERIDHFGVDQVIAHESELGSTQEPPVQVEKFSQYTEKVLPYSVSKYREDDSSPKSDIDIYRELEKLDKISSAQVLPEPTLELPQKELSSIPYAQSTSPFKDVPPLRYTTKPVQYDTSPLKTSYDPYKTFDFKSKLSPKHASNNPFVTASYDKPIVDTTFEYINNKPEISANTYDLHLKSPMMTKESLEFRVRYDDEPTRDISTDYMSLQADRSLTSSKSPYYSNGNSEPLTPTKYIPKEERCLDPTTSSFLEYTGEPSDLLRCKYDSLSPKEYSHGKSTEYDRQLSTLPSLEPSSDLGSYLPTTHMNYHPLSPNRQFPDQRFSSTDNHYISKLSLGLADEIKRPVSHPEFPGKLTTGKYMELPDRGVPSGYQTPSLSLGNIGHSSKALENNYNTATSPKTQFSPFPIRNAPRKPKELTLKLGLYSQNSETGQLKRS
ncbi:TBC1 domain family member 30 [Dufourea novaeangliae]|uniref:TBC1 domain family member 30 n=1 Tax=Dufourea novaeangliae TaxID=178035 RepID=A0A154PK98_DUFNO|nr:TBC1 domain family member 30 [Dufourea novaeangliae]